MILHDDLIKRYVNIYDRSPLKVSLQPGKFGGHRHCSSWDIMILVCQIIFQDHVAKSLSSFMGWSHSRQVTTLTSLVAIDTLVIVLQLVLICNMITQNHVIRNSCDFMGRGSSTWCTIISSLVATSTMVVEIKLL